MRSLSVSNRVIKARCSDDGQILSTDFKLEAEVNAGAVSARLTSNSRAVNTEVVAATLKTYALVSECLPDGIRQALAVEAGCVEQSIVHEASEIRQQKFPYLLGMCRGVVLALENRLSAGFTSPWEKIADLDEISGHLRVILGPSAALTLIHHYLETSAAEMNETHKTITSSISIRESKHSPYPPHVSPLVALDEMNLQEHAEINSLIFDNPAISSLLFQPERWSRPFAALAVDEIGSLIITCDTSVPAPHPGLILDTLTPLANGAGAIDWEANFSLMNADAVRYGGSSSLRLRFDPEHIFTRIYGAIGEPMPALISDPISGERFGLAAALATDLRFSDLL